MSNVTVRFDRLSGQGLVYGLDKAGFTTMLVAVAIAIVAVLNTGLIGLVTTLPITAPLAALGWLKRHGQSLITHLLREVVGVTRKQFGMTKYRHRPEKARIKAVSELSIPGREGRLHLFETAAGSVVLWDAVKQTVTISAMVATPGLGVPQYEAPSTLSEEEREALIYQWATVLGSWTQREHIQRVVVLEQTRPGTVAAESVFADETLSGEASDVVASYRQALQTASGSVVSHVTKLTITFTVTGEAKALSKGNGGGKTGMLALAEHEMKTTEEALFHAGFTRVRWETAREFGAWSRGMIDPAAQASIDARFGTNWEGVDPHAAAPLLIDDQRTYVETDTGFHRSWWIQEWPRYETHPGFMSKLVFAKQQSGQPVRHTFALVASPVQVGQAMKRLDDDKRTWITNSDIRVKAGKPTSQADLADWDAIEQHEADLVAGQGELRFSAYLTTTALSKEELERASASIINACSATGLEPRLIPWQQAEALLNIAYPCGLGMK